MKHKFDANRRVLALVVTMMVLWGAAIAQVWPNPVVALSSTQSPEERALLLTEMAHIYARRGDLDWVHRSLGDVHLTVAEGYLLAMEGETDDERLVAQLAMLRQALALPPDTVPVQGLWHSAAIMLPLALALSLLATGGVLMVVPAAPVLGAANTVLTNNAQQATPDASTGGVADLAAEAQDDERPGDSADTPSPTQARVPREPAAEAPEEQPSPTSGDPPGQEAAAAQQPQVPAEQDGAASVAASEEEQEEDSEQTDIDDMLADLFADEEEESVGRAALLQGLDEVDIEDLHAQARWIREVLKTHQRAA
jgi:hypothetical protein